MPVLEAHQQSVREVSAEWGSMRCHAGRVKMDFAIPKVLGKGVDKEMESCGSAWLLNLLRNL